MQQMSHQIRFFKCKTLSAYIQIYFFNCRSDGSSLDFSIFYILFAFKVVL